MSQRKTERNDFVKKVFGDAKSTDEVKTRFKPSTNDISPSIPRTYTWNNDEHEKRVKFLADQNINFKHLTKKHVVEDCTFLQGNIENFIGFTHVPTGAAGPLRIKGLNANGDFYIPLATTEGALVASVSRGCSAITKSGGARAFTISEILTRAPAFIFESTVDSVIFMKWAHENFNTFKDIAGKTTRYGLLKDIKVSIIGNITYLICYYTTGDASGQNMVTVATDAILKHILETTPIKPQKSYIEGNLSGDKKPSFISFIGTRGKKVTAECEVNRQIVERSLNTTPEAFFEAYKTGILGGIQSGSIGVQGHYANTITAMFMACGQDVACVSEASVGITNCEVRSNGNLYLSVTLPNMIVGTVGGGTRMPTQKECLDMVDCSGEGKASKFAEIVACAVLAGELSITSAIAAGDFTTAHKVLGRRK